VDDEVSTVPGLSMMSDMSPRGTSTDLPPPPVAGSSPAADRPRRSRWRDPRLVVGLAVVAVCALLGARFVGGSSETVPVWAVRASLQEGQPVGSGDVVRRQVRFADQAQADRYVSADSDLPAGATLHRDVGAGELLPRGALGSSGSVSRTEVPLSVDSEAVPSTVRVGSTVDVWVTPDDGSSDAKPGSARSTLVFDDVPVVSVPASSTSLGPSSTRQVIVGVGEDQQGRLPRSIAALSSGTVVLTVRR
jgi:hypothetical protein